MCTLLFLALVVLGAGYWARSKGYKIPFVGKKTTTDADSTEK